jgi:hypothetical protein
MNVILVHGRSQERKDSNELKQLWLNSLKTGFLVAGVEWKQDVDFRFAYYGDILFNESEKLASSTKAQLTDRGISALLSTEELDFRREIIYDAALSMGVTDAQIQAEAQSEVTERGVMNLPIVLATLRLLNQLPNVTSACIEIFTSDVWHYLTDKGVRMRVNRIVAKEIPRDEPCVIIAHSLGTIVAYNLLMDQRDRAGVKAFITLGSPLAISAIVKRLPSDSPPRTAPPNVGLWLNARDPKDTVALHDLSPAMYAGPPTVLNYNKVVNNSDNRHGIVDYLADPFVAKAIFNALT